MKPNDEYGCEDAEHHRRHRPAVRNEKNKDGKKSWRNHITKLGYTAYITAKLNTVQLNKEKTASIKSNQTQAVEKIPRVSIRREVKIPVK